MSLVEHFPTVNKANATCDILVGGGPKTKF